MLNKNVTICKQDVNNKKDDPERPSFLIFSFRFRYLVLDLVLHQTRFAECKSSADIRLTAYHIQRQGGDQIGTAYHARCLI